MAGDINVARKTAALVFNGKTVYIEEGSTMAREGHPILDAAGSMFEPVFVHFEVDEPPAVPVTEEDPGAPLAAPGPGLVEPVEPPASVAPEPKAVRAWAADRGIEVPARGKIPTDVVEQYMAAQQEA